MPADADPAVLQYFYGATLTDARDALRIAHRDSRRFWRWGARNITSALTWDGVLLTGPFGVGRPSGSRPARRSVPWPRPAARASSYSPSASPPPWCGRPGPCCGSPISAVLRVRNVRMICPGCHEHVRYPGYECPRGNCPSRHRDIQAGRFEHPAGAAASAASR